MWLSFKPIKLLTVMVMKCFCAATATFGAMSVVLLGVCPNLAPGLTLKANLAIYFVTMLGCFTLMAIFVNEEAVSFPEMIKTNLKRRMRGSTLRHAD